MSEFINVLATIITIISAIVTVVSMIQAGTARDKVAEYYSKLQFIDEVTLLNDALTKIKREKDEYNQFYIPSKAEGKNMKFTMLENGLDFVLDAIHRLEIAEQNNIDDHEKEKQLKYSLLHISSGIELILKSRLFNEHWTYIFSDMNKANKNDLNNGSLRSVESNDVIERLQRLCGIGLSDNDKRELKNLREMRNRIEHFQLSGNSIFQIEARVNKSIHIIMEFIKEHYEGFYYRNGISGDKDGEIKKLSAGEEELIRQISQSASKLKKHYEDAINMARASIEALLEELVMCPQCNEEFLWCGRPNEGNSKCLFCGYEREGKEVAEEYINNVLGINEYETVKHGGEYPLYECFECGKDSLIYDERLCKYQCFSCGTHYDKERIGRCIECGCLYTISLSNEDIDLCPSCMDYKFHRSDAE